MPFDAFLSYTHEDNARGGGRILALSNAIKDEFALTTGDELEVFVDRDSISWGDRWRDAITSAVGSVPFFIPIVTPKYIRSAECRKELIQFYGQASSQGLDRLLLPIMFIDTPSVVEDSDDEVCAILARSQWVDWRSHRLANANSPEVLRAVNELALRLRDLKAEAKTIAVVATPINEADSSANLKEVIREIDDRLPTWMESVEFDRVARKYWQSSLDVRLERISRLRAQHAPQSAIFATLLQLGSELLPIAENRLAKAQSYARLTIELDPFVNAAIRSVTENPQNAHLLNSLRDGINEAYLNIEPPDADKSSYGLPNGIARANKRIEAANAVVQGSLQYANDGNEVVLSWRERLMRLEFEPVLPLL